MTIHQKCSATTKAGEACQAWAMQGSDPPLCNVHAGRSVGGSPGNQNARTHGFYARQFSGRELADLVTMADDGDLADEIATSRVVLRRLLDYLNTAEPHEIVTITPLVMQATGRIARLLRDQRLLSGDAADEALGNLAGVLDILSELWEVEL